MWFVKKTSLTHGSLPHSFWAMSPKEYWHLIQKGMVNNYGRKRLKSYEVSMTVFWKRIRQKNKNDAIRSIKIALSQKRLFCLHFDFLRRSTSQRKIEKREVENRLQNVRVGKIHRILPSQTAFFDSFCVVIW